MSGPLANPDLAVLVTAAAQINEELTVLRNGVQNLSGPEAAAMQKAVCNCARLTRGVLRYAMQKGARSTEAARAIAADWL